MATAPTVSEAYAMIRFLKQRAGKGDGEKIKALRELIEAEKLKQASLAVDRFFPSK